MLSRCELHKSTQPETIGAEIQPVLGSPGLEGALLTTGASEEPPDLCSLQQSLA